MVDTESDTLADGKAYGWSHWTPLHQAVFWAAPEETVQGLLRLGAKRKSHRYESGCVSNVLMCTRHLKDYLRGASTLCL